MGLDVFLSVSEQQGYILRDKQCHAEQKIGSYSIQAYGSG